jgi:hypothetical protein
MTAKKAPTPIPGDLGRHPGANPITGKIDKTVNKRIAALPFVRDQEDGRCFWSVTPTGDYAVDYQQGFDWVRLVIPFLRYNVGGPLVSWIVKDMIMAGESNGLTLGFMRGLADELTSARQLAVVAAAFGPIAKNTVGSPEERRQLTRIVRPEIRKEIRTRYRDAM